jgi:hypothetical protein
MLISLREVWCVVRTIACFSSWNQNVRRRYRIAEMEGYLFEAVKLDLYYQSSRSYVNIFSIRAG